MCLKASEVICYSCFGVYIIDLQFRAFRILSHLSKNAQIERMSPSTFEVRNLFHNRMNSIDVHTKTLRERNCYGISFLKNRLTRDPSIITKKKTLLVGAILIRNVKHFRGFK